MDPQDAFLVDRLERLLDAMVDQLEARLERFLETGDPADLDRSPTPRDAQDKPNADEPE